jgi:hypothetical protein
LCFSRHFLDEIFTWKWIGKCRRIFAHFVPFILTIWFLLLRTRKEWCSINAHHYART